LGRGYAHGKGTYVDDLFNIVIPELSKDYEIVEDDPDLIYCPTGLPFDLMNKYPEAHIIVNLHSQYQEIIEQYVNESNFSFITHYKPMLEKWRRSVDIHFIPMSIDTSSIPVEFNKVKNSMIYYGNIYEHKLRAYATFMDKYKFDTLSFGKLNYSQVAFSQQECWNLISKYEYGISSGRSAIEMLCMGVKVIIGAWKYGGHVTVDNVQNHWDVNFNSSYYGSEGEYTTVLRSIFDMRNYINNYKKVIDKVAEKL
jgi:hypothetical protein